MNTRAFCFRIVFSIICASCIISAPLSISHAAENAPEAAKKPVAQKQPTAKSKPVPRPSASSAKGTPAQQKTSGDNIQNALDSFAKGCITSMNRQRRPGIYQKEVQRQPDGTFMARYLAVDPDSLKTSYSPTEGHKTITHIGRMDYHEVEYTSIGKNQQQALAGPFNEVNRSPVTELIKYKLGKWSY